MGSRWPPYTSLRGSLVGRSLFKSLLFLRQTLSGLRCRSSCPLRESLMGFCMFFDSIFFLLLVPALDHTRMVSADYDQRQAWIEIILMSKSALQY